MRFYPLTIFSELNQTNSISSSITGKEVIDSALREVEKTLRGDDP